MWRPVPWSGKVRINVFDTLGERQRKGAVGIRTAVYGPLLSIFIIMSVLVSYSFTLLLEKKYNDQSMVLFRGYPGFLVLFISSFSFPIDRGIVTYLSFERFLNLTIVSIFLCISYPIAAWGRMQTSHGSATLDTNPSPLARVANRGKRDQFTLPSF